jgi:hypothetical protein
MIWVLLRDNRPLLLSWTKAPLLPFLGMIENATIKKMALKELFQEPNIDEDGKPLATTIYRIRSALEGE